MYMKIQKIVTIAAIYVAAVMGSVGYQGCKQSVRKCSIITSMHGVYFDDSIHHALPDSAVVRASDFGIALAFLKSDYQCKLNNFSLVDAAYAILPRTDGSQFLDTVKSIVISSNQDFDNSHPAGSSLNEYFAIPDLKQFVISNQYVYQDFGFELLLHQLPANTNLYHQFTVTATLQSQNEPLSYTFEHVKLIP
jgi:hypothetical protein